jgi:hypothetical protein
MLSHLVQPSLLDSAFGLVAKAHDYSTNTKQRTYERQRF